MFVILSITIKAHLSLSTVRYLRTTLRVTSNRMGIVIITIITSSKTTGGSTTHIGIVIRAMVIFNSRRIEL
jgi:hypothetical protein